MMPLELPFSYCLAWFNRVNVLVQVRKIEAWEGTLQWKKGSMHGEDFAGVPAQCL